MRDYGSPFDFFDRLFTSAALPGAGSVFDEPKFPPFNLRVHPETKNVRFEFAVAGYPEDQVSVTFENNRMYLEVGSRDTKDQPESEYQDIKHGIRDSYYRGAYVVPQDKYSVENAKARLENGILVVDIPAREILRPRKIEISVDR